MADTRPKAHHIALTIDGKTVAVELFDTREWPEQSSNDGEYRVRIDRKWYSPAGRYTFLSGSAVGDLIGRLLSGQDLPEEEQAPMEFKPSQRVRVYEGECMDSLPLHCTSGIVAAPPIRDVGGRWRIPVFTPDGTNYYPLHDVEAVGR